MKKSRYVYPTPSKDFLEKENKDALGLASVTPFSREKTSIKDRALAPLKVNADYNQAKVESNNNNKKNYKNRRMFKESNSNNNNHRTSSNTSDTTSKDISKKDGSVSFMRQKIEQELKSISSLSSSNLSNSSREVSNQNISKNNKKSEHDVFRAPLHKSSLPTDVFDISPCTEKKSNTRTLPSHEFNNDFTPYKKQSKNNHCNQQRIEHSDKNEILDS
eukprot:Awhi_evm1s782